MGFDLGRGNRRPEWHSKNDRVRGLERDIRSASDRGDEREVDRLTRDLTAARADLRSESEY